MVMKRARTEDAKDARRHRLIEAALDEFFDKGFSAARMEDIAGRAGLSKGTVYLYFDSKEALFNALIDTLARPNLERVTAIMKHAPSFHAAIDGVLGFAPVLIRESRLPRLLKVLVGDSQSFPELVSKYRADIIDQLLAALGELLAGAKARGEIEIEDPYLGARLVVAPVVLSGLWQAVFNTNGEADVDLETLFRMHGQALRAAFSAERRTQ